MRIIRVIFHYAGNLHYVKVILKGFAYSIGSAKKFFGNCFGNYHRIDFL